VPRAPSSPQSCRKIVLRSRRRRLWERPKRWLWERKRWRPRPIPSSFFHRRHEWAKFCLCPFSSEETRCPGKTFRHAVGKGSCPPCEGQLDTRPEAHSHICQHPLSRRAERPGEPWQLASRETIASKPGRSSLACPRQRQPEL